MRRVAMLIQPSRNPALVSKGLCMAESPISQGHHGHRYRKRCGSQPDSHRWRRAAKGTRSCGEGLPLAGEAHARRLRRTKTGRSRSSHRTLDPSAQSIPRWPRGLSGLAAKASAAPCAKGGRDSQGSGLSRRLHTSRAGHPAKEATPPGSGSSSI